MTHGILLAAGYGRRFGGDKLMASYRGEPLVLAAWRTLRAELEQVVVVSRPDNGRLNDMLAAAGAAFVLCPDAAAGMGRSLALGAANVPAGQSIIVGLGDMPAVSPGTVRLLDAALMRGASACAPEHAGRRGNPVGFAAVWRDALMQLTGDMGARELLLREPSALELIPVQDPGVLRDVDTPEDLIRMSAD